MYVLPVQKKYLLIRCVIMWKKLCKLCIVVSQFSREHFMFTDILEKCLPYVQQKDDDASNRAIKVFILGGGLINTLTVQVMLQRGQFIWFSAPLKSTTNLEM